MRKVAVTVVLVIIPMLIFGQQVSSMQKEEALSAAKQFCSLLSQYSNGKSTYLNNDAKMFNLCSNPKISTYDDLISQKEILLNDYLSIITKNYFNKIAFDFSGYKIEEVFGIPEFNVTTGYGSLNIGHESIDGTMIAEISASHYVDHYIVISVNKYIPSFPKTTNCKIIYSTKSGKILSFTNNESPYVSYLKGLQSFSNKDYKAAIRFFNLAVTHPRFPEKTSCYTGATISSLYLNDIDSAVRYATASGDKLMIATAKGVRALINQDYPTAFENMKIAAEGGNFGAQQSLGCLYAGGIGTAVDTEKGIYWLKKSLAGGNPGAAYFIALFGLHAEIISEEEYRKYLLIAGKSGFFPAYLLLGYDYNATEEYDEAFRWFEKSAKAGNTIGMANTGRYLAFGGTDKQVKEKGIYWLKKSIEGDAFEKDMGNIPFTPNFPKSREDVEATIRKAGNQAPTSSPVPTANRVNTIGQGSNARTTTTQAQTTPTQSSNHSTRTSHSNSSSSQTSYSSSYRKYRSKFNSPKGSPKLGGLSVGYVSKQWVYTVDGQNQKFGFWDDSKVMHGVQAGIRIEPLFNYGFGLNTGLFYEYYYSKSDTYNATDDYGNYDYKGTIQEHVLSLPVHLEYRLHFSENFQLFFYGGIGLDYGLSAKIDLKEEGTDEPYYSTSDVYKSEISPDWKRFNASLEYGGGMRIKAIQLNVGVSKGLVNMSSTDEYKVKQNKNICASFSYLF